MELDFLLTTARTIWQGEGIEGGCDSDFYFKACARVELDPDDMEELDIKENDIVDVVTEYGRVTVYAKVSKEAPHRRLLFMPYGSWANSVIIPSTECTGMQGSKTIPATIVKSKEKVLGAHELIRNYYAEGNWVKKAKKLTSYYDIH
ncbi:MAG: molybdopterin dinucleotide binding domain-containing protein [Methanobacteriaceae archaeon]|jgi:formylmethanofuran dehydrogenase subunit D